jgi:hypothetical protein
MVAKAKTVLLTAAGDLCSVVAEAVVLCLQVSEVQWRGFFPSYQELISADQKRQAKMMKTAKTCPKGGSFPDLEIFGSAGVSPPFPPEGQRIRGEGWLSQVMLFATEGIRRVFLEKTRRKMTSAIRMYQEGTKISTGRYCKTQLIAPDWRSGDTWRRKVRRAESA